MGIAQRVVELAGGDESGRVSHIYHKDGAYFVGKTAHAGVVPFAGVGRSSTDEKSRAFAAGNLFHLVIVYIAVVLAYAVVESLEHDTREIDGRAVREVPALREVESHEFVAGFEACHEYSHIGLCSRVRLHVDPLCTEDFFEPFYGEVLAFVYNFTPAVVTFAGVALGIFVGEARPHGLHYLVADKVLGSDEFDSFQLTLMFAFDNVENGIVSFHACIVFGLIIKYHVIGGYLSCVELACRRGVSCKGMNILK